MKIIYRLFVGLTVLLLLAGLILGNLLKPQSKRHIKEKSTTKTMEEVPRINAFKDDQPLNILVLGVDETATTDATAEDFGSRSDTMMLFTIDPVKKQARLLSIPRDTRVQIPGYGTTKINHAWAHGGYDLVEKTVENFLDIPIDYHAIVRYNAVMDLTEAVGGVEVYLPVNYRYTDIYVKPTLYIDFSKGYHLVKGKEAVNFLRIRKAFEDQDIGRINQQQGFLMSLFQKLKSKSMIFKFPELVRIANDNVESNLSYGQIADLGYFGLSLSQEDITTDTLEGEEARIDGVSYWLVDQGQARKQARRLEKEEEKPEEDQTQGQEDQDQENQEENQE